MDGPIIPRERIIEVLETVLVSGDRIVLEGDNQKQVDFCRDLWSKSIQIRFMIYTWLYRASVGRNISRYLSWVLLAMVGKLGHSGCQFGRSDRFGNMHLVASRKNALLIFNAGIGR